MCILNLFVRSCSIAEVKKNAYLQVKIVVSASGYVFFALSNLVLLKLPLLYVMPI